MTRKSVVCLAVSGGVLVLATVLTLHSPRPVPAAVGLASPVPLPSSPVAPVSPASGPAPTADRVSHAESAIPPLPANATHVPDDYLLKLSTMVNLLNAEERNIDKAQWIQAVPIAEQLVQGPCDCEQRNWLNHFIAMGHEALTGSDEQYYELAGKMRKMARNDAQLAAHPEFFGR